MNKSFLNRLAVIFAAAAVSVTSLTSCLDEKDPEFNVDMAGYIWQSDDNGKQKFEPLLWITSSHRDFPLETVEMKSTKNTINFAHVENNDYQMVSKGSFSAITDFSNNYQVTAVAKGGELVSSPLELKFEAGDTISVVEVKDFKADTTQITCKLKESKNIAGVGIIITPFSTTMAPSKVNSIYKVFDYTNYTMTMDGKPVFKDGWMDIKFPIKMNNLLSNAMKYDICKVNIFVLYRGIARESTTEKTWAKGAWHFEEDR